MNLTLYGDTRLKFSFEEAPSGIVIFRNGKKHYFYNAPEKTTFFFNAPLGGVYTVKGANGSEPKNYEAQPLEATNHAGLSLPTPERVPQVTSNFISDRKAPDSTPARMNRFTGEIQTAEWFNDLPAEVKHFILLHEQGHNYYKTEEYCDLYAVKMFISQGFNPSQAVLALELGIHGDNRQKNERLNNVVKALKKMNS